jgi:selenocysteine-specific elongation factor
MIVCTAGHVDHGKTSLIKGITGIDTDRLEEEKKRGLTIEAGYAYCDINAPGDATGNAVRVGFVDMPGHERFVHNMLASISGIDLGLLIIAADDGPMPQTREHLEILQLLNMTKGAIIITKIDRVDNQTLRHTETTIQQFLRNSFLKNAPVFKVSNSLGTGFEPLKNYLWDTANHLEKKSTQQYFRMSIDRCFSLKGAGCIITGSVIAGAVSREQSLLISPSGIKARVRSIRVQNQNSDQAQTGDRCALNIAGADISSAQIQRGDWIIDEVLHKPTSRIDVLVTLLKDYPNNRPVHLYHGAQHLQARLTALDGKLFKQEKPKLAQLTLHQSIHALSTDYFILRDDSASRTIGGGQIIEPFASFKSRNTSEHVKTLNTLIISEHKKRYQALLNSSDFGLNTN